MVYHAVGNRCAVNFDELKLPIPLNQVMDILKEKGFEQIEVDVVAHARHFIGLAKYRRSARLSEAPSTFDCSSFVKWLYGEAGVWVPRRTIQQRELGTAVPLDDLQDGDIIFVSGRIDYFLTDPADGVGHVGIGTSNRSVIHAANRKLGIIETPLERFIPENGFRGVRRLIPSNQHVYVFLTPPEREIECSDDIRWVVLQNL